MKLECPICIKIHDKSVKTKMTTVGEHLDTKKVGMRWWCCDNCFYEVVFTALSKTEEEYQKRLNDLYIRELKEN